VNPLRRLDTDVLRLARTAGHSPARERGVASFSRLGEHAGVWLALGLAGAGVDRARRGPWLRATRTVALTYVANTALKLIVRRRRPQLEGLPALVGTPTGLSFPSAHSSTSFAAAGAFAELGVPAAPLYGLAATLALSRLYLGVHYPSDLVAGAALGSGVRRIRQRGERPCR
jgi:membrane-associated phospholipid phosphatase